MTIRRQPEDFVVHERLGTPLRSHPDAAHRHAVYSLEKRSLTTPEAAHRLARALGVRPADASWAGLKDKHALTTQHVALPVPMDSPPLELAGDQWRARAVGWLDRPLAADDVDRNEFTIAVRDLSPSRSREMDSRARLLQVSPSRLLVPNYFGEQRFASARHRQGFAARALALGEFDTALRLMLATPARKDSGPRRALTRLAAASWGRWNDIVARAPRSPLRRPFEVLAAGGSPPEAFESLPHVERQFAVEAYQSWLWNAAASAWTSCLPGCWIAPGDFGDLAFAPGASIPPEWRARRCEMPSPSLTPGDPWRNALLEVLVGQGLRAEQLRIPGARRPRFDRFDRPLLVEPGEFHLEPARADEISPRRGRLVRVCRFSLPGGAYATVLLRALGA